MEQISPGEWDQVLNTNLSGAFFVIQAALPLLRPAASNVTVAAWPRTLERPITCIMLLPKPGWST
jgi:NAD(P)-dependent dehydrogenase (short-subunit alcohol dehydrogenase family)